MKTIKYYLVSLILALVIMSCNEASNKNKAKDRRLRDIVSEKYANTDLLIGGTTGSWAFDSISGQIMDKEFSYVTPENDFKHGTIRKDSNTWNWTAADAWIEHIKENKQVLRIHGPISPQCSRWATNDSLSPELLEKEMKTFMEKLCKRYNGVNGITMLDVVNETVHEGDWKKDEPGLHDWEIPWYKIGQDTDSLKTPLYIAYAFEMATKYAPDMKLIYNQHEHPDQIASWNIIKSTITYLRNKNLRVDGIGWQGHVDDGWATKENLAHLSNLIDWCFENDLSFHVTEANVWIDSTNVNTPFESQAETFSKILNVVLDKQKEGEVTWSVWNIDDKNSWHPDKKGTLFDENYKPKPAYYAIQKALESH